MSSTFKSSRERRGKDSGNKSLVAYTCMGIISLENCVTAVTENLIVNLGPSSSYTSSSSSSSSSRKKNDQFYHDDGNGNRVLVGATHLDTFLIHEVITNNASASLSSTSSDDKEFFTKHVNTVQLPSSLQNRCVVFRAKWVSVSLTVSVSGAKDSSYSNSSNAVPINLLILCTNLAAYFYNELGTKQLFKFEWDSNNRKSSGASSSSSSDEPYDNVGGASKTITATKHKILLGNERGEIYLFTYHPKEKKGGGSVAHFKTIKVCSEPVSELCARSKGLVAVGTVSGCVSIWTGLERESNCDEDNSPLKTAEYILSKPEPVTGIVLWYPYAIVSYGSGIIRMFNLIQKVLTAQVFAHARWISSMDLCPGSNLLLSVAEDDEARIWSLRRRQKGEQRSPIKLHSSVQIEDVNFIGGKFLNGNGTLIALANLGSKDLALCGAV